MLSRKVKDNIIKVLIYLSAAATVGILAIIIGFIFIKGIPGISINFLTRGYEDKTTYVTTELLEASEDTGNDGEVYVSRLGITLEFDGENALAITEIDKDSPLKKAVDENGNTYEVKKGDAITRIGRYKASSELKDIDAEDEKAKAEFLQKAVDEVNGQEDPTVKLKVVRIGGGIVPMAVTTLYMIALSLLIAGPIGILAAVYLNEYAKPGKIMSVIHFAIQNLAGIPSIIYGLFGSLFFVQILKMQYSLLAGALTVSIILLPTIITTTEETLKAIPNTYRESSLGLGATQLQTISRVVLPNALPGILVAILLSIGRIVGESAALLLTAGTVAQIPQALFGNSASGATLTIKAYTLMKEENDLTSACAIGIVLIVIIVLINVASKLITSKFLAKKGLQK